MTNPVDTSDFQYKIESDTVPDDFGTTDKEPDDDYGDVESYEGNKSYAIMNMKRLIGKLERALDVSLKLGDDANNTAALGKIAEIARVIMDSNTSIVDIARKDVEMKDEKEKARKAESGAGQPGAGMSTKDIIRALAEVAKENPDSTK